MAQLPDSVGQHSHAGFENKRSLKAPGAPKTITIGVLQFLMNVAGKCRGFGDRNHAGAGVDVGGDLSGGPCYRGPKFINRLSTHNGNSSWRDMRGCIQPFRTYCLADDVILPLYSQEVCDLYHSRTPTTKPSIVNFWGKVGTKVTIYWRHAGARACFSVREFENLSMKPPKLADFIIDTRS